MSRRTGRLVLALALACAGMAGFGEPVRRMRVGLLTDTHVTENPNRCELVRKAMALFARERVDAICHLGDLADTYSPKGFELYRQAVEEAFGDKVPLTLYAFGGHDRNQYQLQPGETDREEAVWAIMKKYLKVSHGLYDLVEFRGHPFVIIQEYFRGDRAQQLIAKAVADYPGKPVFVLMHEPGIATTDDSCAWGNAAIRTICEKHPQVIHLSGHVHGSNRNEHNIWQGAYTEVNVGCLKHWYGHIGNCSTWANYKYDDGVMVMDVFDDAVTIHRYALRTGAEYRPGHPWSFPLPFDAATAPYAPATRRAKSRPPVWPDGAAVAVVGNARNGDVRLTVPEALHDEAVYRYTAELYDAAGRRITLKQSLGEFWKTPESTRTGKIEFEFCSAYFPTAGEYTVKVRPEDFYGNLGEARTATVVRKAAETGWRTAWRAKEPMKELAFGRGYSKKPLAVSEDGWLHSEHSSIAITLPESSTLPAGSGRARIVYTLEDEHRADGTWELGLQDALSGKGLCGPLLSVEGKAGPVTYVQDFKVPKDAPCRLRIPMNWGGMASRLRITDIRVDVKDLPKPTEPAKAAADASSARAVAEVAAASGV